MKTPKTIKKRNPLARVLWSSQYIKTVENRRVYKRKNKHSGQDRELVLFS